MNIIHTLPCGCHRGLRECHQAASLRVAAKLAYDQGTQFPLFSKEQTEAYLLHEYYHNAYLAHVEQGRESVVMPV